MSHMRKMINANNILVKTAFFWVITQLLVVISYRRFGPLFKGQESHKILVDDPEHLRYIGVDSGTVPKGSSLHRF